MLKVQKTLMNFKVVDFTKIAASALENLLNQLDLDEVDAVPLGKYAYSVNFNNKFKKLLEAYVANEFERYIDSDKTLILVNTCKYKNNFRGHGITSNKTFTLHHPVYYIYNEGDLSNYILSLPKIIEKNYKNVIDISFRKIDSIDLIPLLKEKLQAFAEVEESTYESSKFVLDVNTLLHTHAVTPLEIKDISDYLLRKLMSKHVI